MEISNLISLEYPELLLLAVPIGWLYWKYIAHRNILKHIIFVLLILLLAFPSLIKKTSALDTIVLVDRSLSISSESRAKQLELLELIKKNKKKNDRITIISFNDDAYIEKLPGNTSFQQFNIPYSENASDLAAAIELAGKTIDPNRNSCIFILSDGEYTGLNPQHSATLLKNNVPIYYRNLGKSSFYDLAVSNVIAPNKAFQNEAYTLRFTVYASSKMNGYYRILRNKKPIAGKDTWIPYQFNQGENEIIVNDASAIGGIHHYQIEVKSNENEKEAVISNNTGESYIKILAQQPILVVNNTGNSDNLTKVLSAGNLKVHMISIGSYNLTLHSLVRYKAVILNNVPILKLQYQQIHDLRRYVEEEGGGLLICGGNRSFGRGGYFNSALDPIIPVSMEQREKIKKVAAAFSMVLDRSGSMACRTPSGDTKMALANNAVAASIDLLGPYDSLSVIAVDSMPHIIVDQQELTNPASVRNDVLSIESMGGGIFTYTGLVAAGEELIKAKQMNKHIILFADAADAEEPGEI